MGGEIPEGEQRRGYAFFHRQDAESSTWPPKRGSGRQPESLGLNVFRPVEFQHNHRNTHCAPAPRNPNSAPCSDSPHTAPGRRA
ncbi:hypothetical protein E1298_25710 [Actinomadura rubrisoli]|uniref:Uncharacterized protein n=2 Tax=Actinomadura rubrisoli TaxID=2530368 RepID=A0A4R5B7P8_9ACTN|nr:hypothetical protein [Actinomadura rubrisoli]TDD80466.1 hypothetical protein E1298_25710 [Actinomadura rubrisoli]